MCADRKQVDGLGGRPALPTPAGWTEQRFSRRYSPNPGVARVGVPVRGCCGVGERVDAGGFRALVVGIRFSERMHSGQ